MPLSQWPKQTLTFGGGGGGRGGAKNLKVKLFATSTVGGSEGGAPRCLEIL